MNSLNTTASGWRCTNSQFLSPMSCGQAPRERHRSRRLHCQVSAAFWDRDRSQSRASQQGEALPVIIPDVVPPPSKGNQYTRRPFVDIDSGAGAGGRGGGAFSTFSRGGGGWSSGSPFGGFFQRLRLMLLSTLWATCVYLIFATAFRCLGWLDQQLGVTAGLGWRWGWRGLRSQSASQSYDLDNDSVEVGGVLHAAAGGPLLSGAAVAQAASTADSTGTPLAAIPGGTPAAALQQGQGAQGAASVPSGSGAVTGRDGGAGAGVQGLDTGSEGDSRAIGVAGATSSAPAEVGMASVLDAEQQAHLDALKRYGARRAGSANEQHDFGASATGAYFMIMCTMAFFFIAQ